MEQAGRATGATEVDNNDRLIDQIERADAEVAGDRDVVKSTIDLEARRQRRSPWNTGETKMFSPIECDRANRSTAVHAEQSRFPIDECANEEMILALTSEGVGFKARRRRIPWSSCAYFPRRKNRREQD